MKKLFKIMTLAIAGVFALASCGDDVPAPYPTPNPGGGDEPSTEVVEVTCAKAVELCAALEDNASSAETYAITGYITDVFATVNNNQQSFWLSDNNDGQKMVQAYWANLPEGVEKFVAGSKVKITGKLLKYVKNDGTVITEVKNADVEILEAGTDQPGGEAIDITCAKAVELCAALADNASSSETYAITGYITDVFATVSKVQQSFWMSDNNDGQKMVQAYWANLPEGVEKFVAGSKVKITGKLIKYVKTDGTVITEIKNADVEILEAGSETPDTPSEDNTFAGADATVVMSEAYSECTDGSVDATPITFDAVQVSFDKNGGNNVPKYFWNGNAVRMYAMNTMTITSDKQIAKIVIKCTAPDSKNYNGNDEMTTTAGSIQKADDNVMIVVDGINQSAVTITHQFTAISGGTQLRIHSMGVYYVK